MKTTPKNKLKQFDDIYSNTEIRIFFPQTGVRIYGIYYYSDELNELIKKLPKRQKLEIRLNNLDLGHVYIFSSNEKIKCKVFARNFEYADGLSLKQHKSNCLIMRKKLQHKYYRKMLKLCTRTSADNPEIKIHMKGKIERFLYTLNKTNTAQNNIVNYAKK